jgi:DNA-binding CsgD family transcriptional regulator
MRNCLKCSVKIALDKGLLADVPWVETPCAKCVWIEDTFFSIPYDEAEDDDERTLIPSSVLRSQVDAYRRENVDSESTLTQSLPVAVLNELVNRILVLPPEQRDVVSYRFQGKTYKEIAQIMGTSSQCSEMRHKIAMRNFPELKALFPVKTAKHKRHVAKAVA